LKEARQRQETQAAELQQQIAQADAASAQIREQNAKLQATLAHSQEQSAQSRQELQQLREALTRAQQESGVLGKDLSAQLEQARGEAARWKKEIEKIQAQGSAGNEALQQAAGAAAEARKELEACKAQLAEVTGARENLEFQLELQKEEAQKALQGLRDELKTEMAARDKEIAGLREKAEAASKLQASPAASAQEKGKAGDAKKELAKHIQMLEQQRDELAKQLFTVQDQLKRQEQEWVLARNVLEGKVLDLEQRNEMLEGEKEKLRKRQAGGNAPAAVQEQLAAHRDRLLRQARVVRQFRKQVGQSKTSLESNREDLAQQREQLRLRKENLEQVKRLLEKQEMVMARKLADHNAIKTVAAVGIFVIMILGSAFAGVYRFVRPVYRSEAIVQLAAPKDLQGADLENWLNKQMAFVRDNDVTFGAWKILRGSDEHYSMHDVRDEWVASLNKNLAMQLDAATQKLFIRYSGPDAEGVSQVCNALAVAYATPGMRDSGAPGAAGAAPQGANPPGMGAQVVAKATISAFPAEDNRLMISMYVVAGVLAISLLFVMLFRHFVARQLKEIDEMADAQELDEMRTDLPGDAPQAA
jgi:hypothetical protein